MKKHLIIWTDENGDLVVDVLMDGYNIIEHTIYNAGEQAKALLDQIEEETK